MDRSFSLSQHTAIASFNFLVLPRPVPLNLAFTTCLYTRLPKMDLVLGQMIFIIGGLCPKPMRNPFWTSHTRVHSSYLPEALDFIHNNIRGSSPLNVIESVVVYTFLFRFQTWQLLLESALRDENIAYVLDLFRIARTRDKTEPSVKKGHDDDENGAYSKSHITMVCPRWPATSRTWSLYSP